MNFESIASAHDADILILYTMIDALLATHPDPAVALAAFREKSSALVKGAPDGTPEEQLVELRARIAQNLLVWEKTTAASATR